MTYSDVALAAAIQWIERDPKSRAVHMTELFRSASIAKCTQSFLHQVMRKKVDVIFTSCLHQTMHKFISEELLDKDCVPSPPGETGVDSLHLNKQASDGNVPSASGEPGGAAGAGAGETSANASWEEADADEKAPTKADLSY
jgi:hypothetical protein